VSGQSWEELLGKLEDNADADSVEWGDSLTLAEGDTFVGWWRGRDTYEGEDKDTGRRRETPIYLLRDRDGNDVFIWGGRVQLDKRIKAANPKPGDRIAIRRLEDAPPKEPGFSPAWRVRVAVEPGRGSMPGGGPPPETSTSTTHIPFHHLDRFELS
jgi:hypothetical protein